MNRTRSVLAAAAAAALLPLSASAAGIGAYAGVMDTELLALTAVVSHYCATAARG
jgi:hypothetical protein